MSLKMKVWGKCILEGGNSLSKDSPIVISSDLYSWGFFTLCPLG